MSKFEVGKTYRVAHSRKGRFTLKITGGDDEFVTGLMVEGTTRTLLPENRTYTGEELTARTSLMQILEEVEGQPMSEERKWTAGRWEFEADADNMTGFLATEILKAPFMVETGTLPASGTSEKTKRAAPTPT